MKISADPNHPDYTTYHAIAEVYFQGVLLKDCLHADDEAHIVEVPERTIDGEFVIKGEHFLTTIKHGKVKIVIPNHYVTPEVPNE
jgi:hypothetical protein